MPKVYLKVPLYVAFDPEEGTPPLDELTDWLHDAATVDVDTEGYDDPHGFAATVINWDKAVRVTAAEFKGNT